MPVLQTRVGLSLFPMLGALAIVVLFAVVPLLLVLRARSRARRAGYRGLGEYLRSVPRTDAEKRDAIELTLKGLVICMLGVLIQPLVIIGVFPLYYGVRKLCLAWLGLEILEDPDETSR